MKRRGFTLIELMVVIAIIIILAAIAIPNYLTMTQRAKKSRIASDMATLATGLETFKTDWGKYPIASTTYEAVDVSTTVVYTELSGNGTGTPVYNKADATNAVGEKNGGAKPFIEYIKAGTMNSMTDPLNAGPGSATTFNDGHIYYKSDATGDTWKLGAYTGDKNGAFIYRTDSMSTVSNVSALP
jgi:prepilin-type N-terminal cleavage/methylation domain-containing protein